MPIEVLLISHETRHRSSTIWLLPLSGAGRYGHACVLPLLPILRRPSEWVNNRPDMMVGIVFIYG